MIIAITVTINSESWISFSCAASATHLEMGAILSALQEKTDLVPQMNVTRISSKKEPLRLQLRLFLIQALH